MNNMDMIMGQLVTATTIKGNGDMMELMWNMVMIMIITWIFKEFLPEAKKHAHTYIKKKSENVHRIELPKENTVQTVTFMRVWNNDAPSSIEEAVLDYICNLSNPPIHIKRSKNTYIVNSFDEFVINKNLSCKIKNTKYDQEGTIESIEFQLRSKTWSTKDIKDFVHTIHTDYENTKVNQLGDRKYYFEEILIEDDLMKNLMWTMTRFHTNKKLNNIFGEHTTEIKNRVNLFINDPEWYAARGIPHTLGILLHGDPGCGKTSLIKALAHETGRHIFDLKLRKTTTQTQLRNLFYNDRISAVVDGKTETLIIPQNQRLYVIEDIDCLSSVVLSRDYQPQVEEADMPEIDGFGRQKPKVSSNEKLNLAFILNLLDGVLEVPGRFLITTSNYPEKLDKAFTRPGRMDLNIKFEKASKAMIDEMAQHFYSLKDSIKSSLGDIDHKFTPAEVNKYLCINYTNLDAFISDINTAQPANNVAQIVAPQPTYDTITLEKQRVAEMYPMPAANDSLTDIF